jgi:hypothetical protein
MNEGSLTPVQLDLLSKKSLPVNFVKIMPPREGVYSEGVLAFKEGKSLDDNPYLDFDGDYDLWEMGWVAENNATEIG